MPLNKETKPKSAAFHSLVKRPMNIWHLYLGTITTLEPPILMLFHKKLSKKYYQKVIRVFL